MQFHKASKGFNAYMFWRLRSYLTISAFAFLTPILVKFILTWSRGFARENRSTINSRITH